MAIDPIRTGSPRILPHRTPAAAANRPAGTAAPGSVAPGSAASTPAEPRRALVQARIEVDYYSQSHVREKVIASLLQFLDEE